MLRPPVSSAPYFIKFASFHIGDSSAKRKPTIKVGKTRRENPVNERIKDRIGLTLSFVNSYSSELAS